MGGTSIDDHGGTSNGTMHRFRAATVAVLSVLQGFNTMHSGAMQSMRTPPSHQAPRLAHSSAGSGPQAAGGSSGVCRRPVRRRPTLARPGPECPRPITGFTPPKATPHPAATIPPKLTKQTLDLEFIKMSELTTDAPSASDPSGVNRRPPRPAPVTDLNIWLDCYSRLAALLSTRSPEKAPEFWAYQSTIVQAARNYEGATWVAYDRFLFCL